MPDRLRPAARMAALAELRPWVERARQFSGWEFPEVEPRRFGGDPPWDYEKIVRSRAAERNAVLDLGTGGGERLAAMRSGLPPRVVATEEWAVNAPVAFRRLRPLGVRVVRAKSTRLPFRDASFDLVIDRHEEFSPVEVDRVLAPGGHFVTQQVGRHDWTELRRHIPRMTDFGGLEAAHAQDLVDRGFEVQSQEHEARVAYPSLGAFAFMLCVSPWTIPDFSVDGDLDALLAFESEQRTGDGLVVTECRYLIVARKPGGDGR